MRLQTDTSATDDLKQWLGQGQLALSLIPATDTGMQPYQGLISLVNGNLSACLEDYFHSSEQLATRLHFASSADAVTGLLLQRLPDDPQANELEIDEANEMWEMLTALAATVTQKELSELEPSSLLHRLFHDQSCKLHPYRELAYRCTCSQEKSDTTLMLLGREDLLALLEEQGEIGVDCEFCGSRYHYNAADVRRLIEASLSGSVFSARSDSDPGPKLH